MEAARLTSTCLQRVPPHRPNSAPRRPRRPPPFRALAHAALTSSADPKKFSVEPIDWPSPDDEIKFWNRDFPSWDTTGSSSGLDSAERDPDPMHVVHVTAEMAPIAKVGGLGDVVTGLARACISRGHNVEIMLPFYECIPEAKNHGSEASEDV
ncbi:hypothetical protein QJS10_CPA02g01605 [Acorus calamus]|uniref:starch synthase n=1 Tax=Acorus calamus TaxID=4465 RepID=A0AAV9FEJ7_ACOCL|nr:hypothetical protein QJS10_CPA02g01605 [Acorus calamus]